MFRKITFAVVGLFFLGWVIFEIRKSNKTIQKEEDKQEPILTVEQQQALENIDYTQLDFSSLEDLDFSNFNLGNFGAIP